MSQPLFVASSDAAHVPCHAGKSLRDHGCQLADSASKAKSLALRIAVLKLAVKGQPFSADDLPDAGDAEKRSNRFGSAFLNLSRAGLIVFTGECRRSSRAHRHSGLNRVWHAPDVARCLALAATLQAELNKLEQPAKQRSLLELAEGGDEHAKPEADEPAASDGLPLSEVMSDGIRQVLARLKPLSEAGGQHAQ